MPMVDGPLEASEKAGVFGIVVSAVAEELRQLGKDRSSFILEESAIAGGAGITTGSSITVGDDPVCRTGGGCCIGEKTCCGLSHRDQFTASGESSRGSAYVCSTLFVYRGVVTLTPESETA